MCKITSVQEPLSLENTAERYVRPQIREAFVDLCTLPISHYLERFGFKSDLIKAMYATTDAFSGLSGGWDTPGTGMNFLVHNMCAALFCFLSCENSSLQSTAKRDCLKTTSQCVHGMRRGLPAKKLLATCCTSFSPRKQRFMTIVVRVYIERNLMLSKSVATCNASCCRCRLEGADGTWMVVQGGMGA